MVMLMPLYLAMMICVMMKHCEKQWLITVFNYVGS